MYVACGNHDSYNVNITDHLDKLQTYTGHDLSFYIEKMNDVFIFIGQPANTTPMTDEQIKYLQSTLETFKNKRCFVFIHSYMEEDSGDPGDYRENSIFEMSTIGKNKAYILKAMLNHYKNTVLFHGHSHMKFDHQEKVLGVNTYIKGIYTDCNGLKSVHVPSLYTPRDINENASGVGSDSNTPEDLKGSQGYIVDVYDNYIVLNGYDFLNTDGSGSTIFNPKPSPLGTYKLDTTIREITDTFDETLWNYL